MPALDVEDNMPINNNINDIPEIILFSFSPFSSRLWLDWQIRLLKETSI